MVRLALTLTLSMNLDEKAPSPRPSPAEREREKGRQWEGHAAKFIGSMCGDPFRGNLAPRKGKRTGAALGGGISFWWCGTTGQGGKGWDNLGMKIKKWGYV